MTARVESRPYSQDDTLTEDIAVLVHVLLLSDT